MRRHSARLGWVRQLMTVLAGISLLAVQASPAAANGPVRLDNGQFFFGLPSEDSIHPDGALRQPFWIPPGNPIPLQFTFADYPLSMLIRLTVGGSDIEFNLITRQNADATAPTANWKPGTLLVTGTTSERTFTGILRDSADADVLRVTHRYRIVGNTLLEATTTLQNVGTTPITNLEFWVGTKDDFLGCVDSDIEDRFGIRLSEEEFEEADERCFGDRDPGYTADRPRKRRGTYDFGGQPIPNSGADLSRFEAFTAATGGVGNSILIQSYNDELEDSVGGEWVLFASAFSGADTRIGDDLELSGTAESAADTTARPNDVQADNSYAMLLPLGTLSSGTGGDGQSLAATWYYAVGSTRFGDPVSAPVVVNPTHPMRMACTPDPVVPGATVTCEITQGDPGIDILWRASYNPVFAGQGVRLDEDGRGTFTFVAPRTAQGQVITVELVEWLPVATLQVSGVPLPTRLPAGEGPLGVPLGLALGALMLTGAAVLRLRRAGGVS
jgi:hypothetical protein